MIWLLDVLQLEQSCWKRLLTMSGHPPVLKEPTETHLPLCLCLLSAVIKGMCHHAQLFHFSISQRGLKMPKLAFNSQCSYLSTLGSWDYKCVSLLGIHFLFLFIAYLRGS